MDQAFHRWFSTVTAFVSFTMTMTFVDLATFMKHTFFSVAWHYVGPCIDVKVVGFFLTGNLPLYARRVLKWEPLPKKDCSVGPWSMLPFLKAHAKLNVKTTLKFCFLNNMSTVHLWCNQSIRTTPEKKTILLHSLWGDCCFRWQSRNVPYADGPRGGQTLFLLNSLHCLMLHSLSTPCEWANVELATLDFPEGFFDKVFSWALYCEFVLFDEVLYVWKNTTTLYVTMVEFVYSINMVAIYQD